LLLVTPHCFRPAAALRLGPLGRIGRLKNFNFLSDCQFLAVATSIFAFTSIFCSFKKTSMKKNFESLSENIFNVFNQHQATNSQEISGGSVGGNAPSAISVTCNPSTNCTHFDMDTYDGETKSVKSDMGTEQGQDC